MNYSGNFTINESSTVDERLVNSTSEKEISKVIALSSFYLLQILALTGNGIVLAGFIIDRKQLLKVNFNFLLVNQTVVDLCSCLVNIPLSGLVWYMRFSWPHDRAGCTVYVCYGWLILTANILATVAIAVDRCWAGCWSITYRRYATRRRMLKCIAAIWATILLTVLPYVILQRSHNTSKLCALGSAVNLKYLSVLFTIFIYNVPSVVMISCMCAVYWSLVRTGRKIQPHIIDANIILATTKKSTMLGSLQQPQRKDEHSLDQLGQRSDDNRSALEGENKESSSSSIKTPLSGANTTSPDSNNYQSGRSNVSTTRSEALLKDKTLARTSKTRIFRTLVCIAGVFVILWAPVNIYVDLISYGSFSASYASYTWMQYAVSVLMYANSAVNPFMYTLSNHRIRRSALNVVRKLRQCVRISRQSA